MAKKAVRKTKKASRKVKAPAKRKATATKPVGKVTHYYGNIRVGIVKFKKPMKIGAMIGFRGASTDFTQPLASMQYDHKDISRAPKGKEIGVKVKKRVRDGDEVFEVK